MVSQPQRVDSTTEVELHAFNHQAPERQTSCRQTWRPVSFKLPPVVTPTPCGRRKPANTQGPTTGGRTRAPRCVESTKHQEDRYDEDEPCCANTPREASSCPGDNHHVVLPAHGYPHILRGRGGGRLLRETRRKYWVYRISLDGSIRSHRQCVTCTSC